MVFQALFIASSAISAAGSLMAGAAQQQASELNAFNIETQKVVSDTQAAQNHNDRLELFRNNLSSNIAFMFSTGRDVDVTQNKRTTSVAAFLEKQKETVGADIRRLEFQKQMEGARYQAEAAAERQRGRAAMLSGVVGAVSSMVGAVYKYEDIRLTEMALQSNAPATSPRPTMRPF